MTFPIPKGYCQCGCGQQTKINTRNDVSRGWIKGEARQYVFPHSHKPSTPQYAVEDRGYKTPCWIWQWQTNDGGYAKGRVDGEYGLVHRLLYQRKHGPIPDNLPLDHLCEVRPCINPEHLEVTTSKENNRRGKATRLNPELIPRIWQLELAGVNRAQIARQLNITLGQVRSVIEWRAWVDKSTDFFRAWAIRSARGDADEAGRALRAWARKHGVGMYRATELEAS